MVYPDSRKVSSRDNVKDFFRSDHRYLPRWEVDTRIVCKLEDGKKIYECRTKNLNSCGTCLFMEECLNPSQKVNLKIYLSEHRPVDVEGHIIWNKDSRNGNLAGIVFENTCLKTQELILNHAFEIRKDEVVKHWYDGWEARSKAFA